MRASGAGKQNSAGWGQLPQVQSALTTARRHAVVPGQASEASACQSEPCGHCLGIPPSSQEFSRCQHVAASSDGDGRVQVSM